ncbi:Unknown protein [Striga hermonthica]|uniref:FBD domain-containing protein n=1 Tax=Striga hermonthica TaxID=68872 RepID=A0A9N7MQK7_STRHE|nr:Unknown protein [Striga hermonthica]
MASIDRLTALPDDIISHILSLLPFKTSVSTGALSARWRRLWTYAPNIQLTEESQLLNFIIDSIPESNPYHEQFVDVLTKILSQFESHSMNTLRLKMFYFDEHELEARLESVFARNVKTLDLTLRYGSVIIRLFDEGPRFDLRLNLFDIKLNNGTSKTLVDLRLNLFFVKIKIGTVCLPALKRLYLGGVTLDGTLDNLLFCCPVLEEFTAYYIFIQCDANVVSHCISSSTMKRLVFNCEFPYKLKIDTPALNYLLLRYEIPHNFSVGSMDFLVEAHIDVGLIKVRDLTPVGLNIKFHNLTKLRVEGYCRFISYIVEKANKLEALNVIHYHEPECEMEPVQLPMANSIMKLHNLIKLELQVDWWFLTYFLDKADKLKVLTIRSKGYNNRKRWLAAPLQVPNCLSSHLKIVTIHELEGTEHELDMVRYLLKNAKVLERMELHCLAESIRRISSFDRGSEKCEIVFHEYLDSGIRDEDLGF